ncbi:carbohydrate-binding module family 13 protein [Rhizophagus clarus]|uniref:Carbohydrate-binding module family 13 protein n=1 Tax=Rhizophagus clarus TaxID=94130 RepID=A0A8H3M9Z2_9GLOM|nr:carbohydrate-binding module family 13 protein [Rhizophagus clarus]
MDDIIFLPKLSQNLLEILNDEEYYDVTIEKNDGALMHIKLPNILPEIFQIILRYIYGGKISLEDYDASDIIKILVAGSELGLQELIAYLQSFLIKTKSNWMEQNFNLIYQTSFENDSLLELQKFCTSLTSKEPNKIFESSNFSSIPEKLLASLIQSDNLQMDEIQVWEHALKWGLAQNPELPSDPTNFSKEDFKTLESNIRQCIPFIRFHNLSSEEFSDKVLPYRKILPKELYEDLLKYFMNPNNNQSVKKSKPRVSTKEINIDSNIITFRHVELISKWIDRLEITDEIKNAYKFKLLLRGSRDGFEPKKFHEVCDNQSNTITIIKVKDSKEILGGYNPIIWESHEDMENVCDDDFFSTTRDSFIFSFKDSDDIESFILSRVKDEKYAIFGLYISGPSFGNGDLYFSRDYGSCSKCDYENLIRETAGEFLAVEYEVFQITR